MSVPDVPVEISTGTLVTWFRHFAETIETEAEELSSLDAAIGDADHGANLRRGCHAAVQHLEAEPPADIAAFGRGVGMQLIATVGGASGVLYGSFFLAFGSNGGSAASLGVSDFVSAWRAGTDNVATRGKAEIGDKTMLDALLPVAQALEAAVEDEEPLASALSSAVTAAEKGMLSTIPLVARKGRASYLGERSAGHQDPGATSSWLLVRSAAETFAP